MIARFSTFTILVFFALCASGLYLVKYEVQAIKDENAALQRQLNEEEVALHLLQSEWVYLNRSERLQELAARYLKLEILSPTQIVSFQSLPLREKQLAFSHVPPAVNGERVEGGLSDESSAPTLTLPRMQGSGSVEAR